MGFNRKFDELDSFERELDGKKVNSLRILYRDETDPSEYDKWICECDCGNRLKIDGRNLRKPNPQKTCGHGLPKGHKNYREPGRNSYT